MQPLAQKQIVPNPEIPQESRSPISKLPIELLAFIFECMTDSWQRSPDQVESYYKFEKKEIARLKSAMHAWTNIMPTCRLFFQVLQSEKTRLINNCHFPLRALGFKTAKEAAAFAIKNELTSVNLVGYKNEINDALIQDLTEQLPNLRHLFIPHANISDTGLRHLWNLENLASLNIWCNHISDTGLLYLSRLSRI